MHRFAGSWNVGSGSHGRLDGLPGGCENRGPPKSERSGWKCAGAQSRETRETEEPVVHICASKTTRLVISLPGRVGLGSGTGSKGKMSWSGSVGSTVDILAVEVRWRVQIRWTNGRGEP